MKNLKFVLMLSVALLFSLASCNKENQIIEDVTPPVVTPTETNSNPLVGRAMSNADGLDLGCFSINYPFGMSVDGEETEINSEEDFIALLENIMPDDSTYIDFVYPLTITVTEDGSEQTIEDGEALGEVFALCVPTGGWSEPGFPAFLINDLNSCYSLNYPVSLHDYEGNTYDAADEEAFIELVGEYPDLSFTLPLTLTNNETQEVVTVDDEESLFDLLISCDQNWTPIDTTINPGVGEICYACYHVGFPSTYTNTDGDEVVANDLDELTAAFMNGTFVDFSLPITLIGMDGVELVVSTEEELNTAIEACGFTGSGGDVDLMLLYELSENPENDCFELNYPVNVVDEDGNTSSLEDSDAVEAELANDVSVQVVFPISLTNLETGNTHSIDSFEGLFEYLDTNCQ